MPASPVFQNFIAEQLGGFGPVEIKRMFGGAGIFRDGLMFALIANEDQLYFKADAESRFLFEAEGLEPFSYMTAKGERRLTSYLAAPERCLEDPDEMTGWARDAHIRLPCGQTRARRSLGERIGRFHISPLTSP